MANRRGRSGNSDRFYFLGLQNHWEWGLWNEIKRRLLFGRKALTNLDSMLKSRDITLPTKVCIVKAVFFSVVMYGCVIWIIKKAERQRIDVLELLCWRRLLRVPWTARTSKQSILKEISPEYSLERLMLRLKLQYCGHLKWSADSLKTLMLRKIQSRRRRRWQRTKWLDGITNSVDWVWANSGRWWRIGKPGVLPFMELQKVGQDWATELNWTESFLYLSVSFSLPLFFK